MQKNRVCFIVLFFVPLILLALMTLLKSPKAFSSNENRPLAQMPVVSAIDIQTGSTQEDFSSFLSDQIPLRDFWIQTNTFLKRVSRRNEINGIYFGKDHYYFQAFTDDSYSATRMESVFEMMECFIQKQDIPTTVMLVPSPGTVLSDKLPANAPYYDADLVFDTADRLLSCPVIDLRNCFESVSRDTQLYYRTDHHWTSKGARLAYEQFCSAQGCTTYEYTLEQVSNDFYGTLYSKVLDSSAKPDVIYAPTVLSEVTVIYEDGTVNETPYRKDKLTQKNEYAYFFGGNYGTVTIKTSAQTTEKLLVIKDSFANCFVPFLFENYSEIIMLDLRYFGGSIEKLIAENDITQMLFLYETSNFLTDNGILGLQK